AVLGPNRERALLFKDLATLRSDAPLFRDVDELRWTGATDSFPAVAEKIGDPRLVERIRELAARLVVSVLFLVCLLPSVVTAQGIEAVRVSRSALQLDGRLSEDVWRTAPPARGFLQREPNEGAPAADSTEVRFAYDESALWIGARMHSRKASDIRALVTRRDREGSSEQITISLDTHRDRRTAYTFSVTPAGVPIDYFHAEDFESERNYDYNAVWETETRIDSLGWTAEIRIPFTQLRFNPGDAQDWGVNIARVVPETNEQSYFVLVRRNETGWSSRMASLTGIRGIEPSRRIEILPYVAADSRFLHVTDPADPFAEKRDAGIRSGADLKIGMGPNLTLDVTINPDFGQVEADPAEVNLTAYETFFDERRPFFLEGSQLFGGRGFYYSRRIGAAPPGSADTDYQEQLDNTTILGAAKLTGRLPSGLSIAALTALTGRESVRTYDAESARFGTATIAPMSGYAVASVQQEFGKTRSTFGGTVTMVQRDLESGSPLAGLLAKSAYSAIVDSRLRWAGGMYDASAYVGVTHIRGDSLAMLRQQLSSRRYWRRPDASHVEVDPARRSMNGTIMGFTHSKLSGKHWLWDVDYWQESPGLEPNDIGAFGSVDDRGGVAQILYRETTPRSWYRSYVVGVGAEGEWNFDGIRTSGEASAFGNATFRNFWRFNSDVQWALRSLSDALTRGGPLMGTPTGYRAEIELHNRSGARNGWGFELESAGDETGGWEREIELSLSYRPGTQWELSLYPRWVLWNTSQQFVTSLGGGRSETFGTRYIFAHVDRGEVAARFRLNYTFTPRLTLETYAEPFASSGTYHEFGELPAARARELRVYGGEGTGTSIVKNADGTRTVIADGQTFTLFDPDFNVRSFRSNVVFRWEWRPGSTMFVVWQQDRSADRAVQLVRPGDLFDSFNASGDNFFALKISYWLPVR
ncbi:MAG: carbohydrate binding family 9 domain-containing protein, partial [Gemmatimonadota bacterium]|nr:carbohydrate binding family 9 domain-containing protein [Gemmatimonadota bacterium]